MAMFELTLCYFGLHSLAKNCSWARHVYGRDWDVFCWDESETRWYVSRPNHNPRHRYKAMQVELRASFVPTVLSCLVNFQNVHHLVREQRNVREWQKWISRCGRNIGNSLPRHSCESLYNYSPQCNIYTWFGTYECGNLLIVVLV